MKKNLCLSISLLFCTHLFSQSFVDTTKRWNVTKCFSSQWGIACYPESYKLEGDTVLDLSAYKKVYATSDSTLTNWYLRGALRDAGQRVYFHDFTSERLLYDFGANVGDTIRPVSFSCTIGYMIVDSVDTIMIAGQLRRRLIFDFSLTCSYINEWIEGIGSNHGLLNEPDVSGTMGFDSFEDLVCYWKDDTLQWMNPSYTTCYYLSTGIAELDKKAGVSISPNPVTDDAIVEISSPVKNSTWTVYNVMGQIVRQEQFVANSRFVFKKENLPVGIYFYQLRSAGTPIASGKIAIE